MPLTAAALNASLSWTLSKTNSPFGNVKEGPDAQTFSLLGLNLTTYNQILAVSLSVTNGANTDLDLFSFTNFVGEVTGFTKALAILVLPTGANSICVVAPGSATALTWFFGGTTPTHTINPGGCLLHSEPVTGGVTVDATHRKLNFANTGSAPMTVTVVILGAH